MNIYSNKFMHYALSFYEGLWYDKRKSSELEDCINFLDYFVRLCGKALCVPAQADNLGTTV